MSNTDVDDDTSPYTPPPDQADPLQGQQWSQPGVADQQQADQDQSAQSQASSETPANSAATVPGIPDSSAQGQQMTPAAQANVGGLGQNIKDLATSAPSNEAGGMGAETAQDTTQKQPRSMQQYVSGDNDQQSQSMLSAAMKGGKNSMNPSVGFLAALDAEEDPNRKEQLAMAGRWRFNHGMAIARAAADQGDLDKAVEFANHALVYDADAHAVTFTKANDSIIANVKHLGTNQPPETTKMTPQQWVAMLKGPDMHQDAILKGTLPDKLKQASGVQGMAQAQAPTQPTQGAPEGKYPSNINVVRAGHTTNYALDKEGNVTGASGFGVGGRGGRGRSGLTNQEFAARENLKEQNAEKVAKARAGAKSTVDPILQRKFRESWDADPSHVDAKGNRVQPTNKDWQDFTAFTRQGQENNAQPSQQTPAKQNAVLPPDVAQWVSKQGVGVRTHFKNGQTWVNTPQGPQQVQ